MLAPFGLPSPNSHSPGWAPNPPDLISNQGALGLLLRSQSNAARCSQGVQNH
jgi:hypothetical protein